MKFIFALIMTLTISLSGISQEMPLRHLLVTLPKGSKQVGEHRFQSGLSYDDTKKEFHGRFLKSEYMRLFGDEINLPQVRAITYRNFDKNAQFYAINIYLNVQTGLTEIFFVVIEPKT